jgi:hypothetical protein
MLCAVVALAGLGAAMEKVVVITDTIATSTAKEIPLFFIGFVRRLRAFSII